MVASAIGSETLAAYEAVTGEAITALVERCGAVPATPEPRQAELPAPGARCRG